MKISRQTTDSSATRTPLTSDLGSGRRLTIPVHAHIIAAITSRNAEYTEPQSPPMNHVERVKWLARTRLNAILIFLIVSIVVTIVSSGIVSWADDMSNWEAGVTTGLFGLVTGISGSCVLFKILHLYEWIRDYKGTLAAANRIEISEEDFIRDHRTVVGKSIWI